MRFAEIDMSNNLFLAALRDIPPDNERGTREGFPGAVGGSAPNLGATSGRVNIATSLTKLVFVYKTAVADENRHCEGTTTNLGGDGDERASTEPDAAVH